MWDVAAVIEDLKLDPVPKMQLAVFLDEAKSKTKRAYDCQNKQE